MKLTFQLFFVALFANISVSCGQRITSFKVNPPSDSIDPNKKGSETNKGVRKIKLRIQLSGKSSKDIHYKLDLSPLTLDSKPMLVDSIVTIKKSDFKAKKLDTEVKIKLKELDCLPNAENFVIKFRKDKNTREVVSDNQITIKKIDIPDPSVCLLLDESTTIQPYLKSDLTDNGQRTLILNLVLSGKRTNMHDDNITIKYLIIPPAKSGSSPKMLHDFEISIKKDSFNIDGCPKIIKVPVVIQLAPVEKLKIDEQFNIFISKNDRVDIDHAHKLIIKAPELKETGKPTDTPKPSAKKGYSFSNSCISGKNFVITLLPDSIGGKIEVKEERDTVSYAYLYNQFFHTADFAKWLLNIFTTRINRFPCNDCVTCVSYMAERAYEELTNLKKTTTVTQSQTNEIKKGETEKDSATAKKDSASVKTEPAKPDTFVYHISYADTSIFSLSITKEKDLTMLQLCKGTKAGDGDCISERVVDVDEKSLNNRVVAMIQKLTGEETIDAAKIKPANVYGKYKKDEAAKQVKEKTAFEKLTDERLTVLENEKVTYTDVGTVSLKDTTGKIRIYKSDGSLLKETEIDNVKFRIEDGKLLRKQFYIKTRDGDFWNSDAPIAVNRINERGRDHLFRKNIPNDGGHILLGEVLEYTGDGYVPDDTTIILTPAKRAKSLSATSNLNSLINFAIYTDLAGLLGRRANGIINTDVSGRFITNTRNKPRNVDLTPLAFIEGNIVLSKFDSKFKSIDSSSIRLGSNGDKDTIDRMQLIQTAWLKGSVKLNLLSYHFFYYQNFYLNIGARINVVNGDSLFRKEGDIIFFDYYPEVVYSINRLRNFGMDISLRWLQQRVADKESFANRGWESVFNPQIAFFYNPIASQSSKIYLRFNYFANRKKDANNFYQLQFGIKSDLKFGSKK